MFHFIGLKCSHCGSYNTVRNGSETLPLEDVDPTFSLAANDQERNEMYIVEGLIPPDLQLQPTPSTDSEDEYETPSSRGLTDDEDDLDDDDELAEQLLGGIPLLPPWLPQHSDNPDMNYLMNQLPYYLNIDGDSFDEDEVEGHVNVSNWDNPFEGISPFVQLATSLLPNGLMNDADSDSGLPHVWEVSENVSDEREEGEYDEEREINSDGWETDNEEEVVGGDEENLGKEDCQLSVQEESSQLGDVAPAN